MGCKIIKKGRWVPSEELLNSPETPKSEHTQEGIRETHRMFAGEEVGQGFKWDSGCHIHQEPC